MGITVDGNHYTVARGKGGFAHVRLADRSTTKCTRRHAEGTTRYETDLEMQTRAQKLVTKLNAEQERAQPLSACFTLGSPALSASVATILTTEVDCADAGDRRQTGGARAKANTHEAFAALGRQLRPQARRGTQGCEGRPRLRVPSCRVSWPATGWSWDRLADALETSQPLRRSGQHGDRCRAATGHRPAGRAGGGPPS